MKLTEVYPELTKGKVAPQDLAVELIGEACRYFESDYLNDNPNNNTIGRRYANDKLAVSVTLLRLRQVELLASIDYELKQRAL